MNLIELFEEYFNQDDLSNEKKESFLINLYIGANKHDRAVIDNVLTGLCGYTLKTLIKKSKEDNDNEE